MHKETWNWKSVDIMNHYGVSRQTIMNWRAEGMPHLQVGEKTFRYNNEKVKKWVEGRYGRK